ncbi:uncharacterized protein LOC122088308 [Macadamia integrifolia]|uniref:uncharacterized protein LOC122088308 n=1 Tax=Macadamia integrifolia TaxID=60698 RepID=UPI001C4ECA90|nr:uncharacterized protein LOC122088308 [Macadamia integrifolia]
MALRACASSGSSRFQIKFIEGHRYPVHRLSQFACTQNFQSFRTCPIRRADIAHFSEPNKKMVHVYRFRERLWASLPEPVKEFPWRKAEDLVLQHLLIHGERALKWSLITLFIFSFLSDIIFSVVRNRELIVPLGLFIGCTLADFLKETSKELFEGIKEGGLRWHLLGIGSFFVLVKFVSVCFTVQGRVFLSHVGNGGLMQVLWLWRKLLEERESVNVELLHQNDFKSNNV